MNPQKTMTQENKFTKELLHLISIWSKALGFQQFGISNTDLSAYEEKYRQWLAKNYHGEMNYLVKHGEKRFKPEQLIPNTISIISVRMDYLPAQTDTFSVLKNSRKAYISRYALGRDYHKLMRKRLTQLAEKVSEHIGSFGYRAFVDSAPVLEKPIAEKAGLGWIGKNTNLINSKAGSWFFLGEIYTDLPLAPFDSQPKSRCGTCHACLDICPTQAIVAPYQLDARRCISYLTIELEGAIPNELRPLIGNRVYGCDDCQLICPWNKFAKFTYEKDFSPRHQLDQTDLITLFNWDEKTFLYKTEGSAIRRIGYHRWLRNLAVGLGNAPYHRDIVQALEAKSSIENAMVKEHIEWALQQQAHKNAIHLP